MRNKFEILIPIGKNPTEPDFKEMFMRNRILLHKNKADRIICLQHKKVFVVIKFILAIGKKSAKESGLYGIV